MPYCILVIDDTTYNTIAESYFYALIHEAAFMGFPVIANRYDSTYDIPTHWIFLPVFDEHMITTGDFKRGAASLDLPNATWSDIIDDNMPEYDPKYDPNVPPTPEPVDLPTVQPQATTEITDQTSIQWKRYTVGYTNPDLFRFRDGDLPENTKCDVFIKGTSSYRYTEERDHIDGSQTTETP
jgi:hypothetical protein